LLKEEAEAASEKVKRKLVLRNKIQMVGKMTKMLSFMREN
jgi:hypothetical protein